MLSQSNNLRPRCAPRLRMLTDLIFPAASKRYKDVRDNPKRVRAPW